MQRLGADIPTLTVKLNGITNAQAKRQYFRQLTRDLCDLACGGRLELMAAVKAHSAAAWVGGIAVGADADRWGIGLAFGFAVEGPIMRIERMAQPPCIANVIQNQQVVLTLRNSQPATIALQPCGQALRWPQPDHCVNLGYVNTSDPQLRAGH